MYVSSMMIGKRQEEEAKRPGAEPMISNRFYLSTCTTG